MRNINNLKGMFTLLTIKQNEGIKRNNMVCSDICKYGNTYKFSITCLLFSLKQVIMKEELQQLKQLIPKQ